MTNRISSAAFAQAKDLYLKSVRLGREALAARTAMVTVMGLDDEDDIDTFYEAALSDWYDERPGEDLFAEAMALCDVTIEGPTT